MSNEVRATLVVSATELSDDVLFESALRPAWRAVQRILARSIGEDDHINVEIIATSKPS
jgi:hypothetical protein